MVEDNENEIPLFLFEETKSDSHLEAIYLNATIHCIENYFNEVHHVLATKQVKDVHFEQITME